MLKNTSQNREKSTQNRTCNVQRATLHVQKERCNAKTRQVGSKVLNVIRGTPPMDSFFTEVVAQGAILAPPWGPKMVLKSHF